MILSLPARLPLAVSDSPLTQVHFCSSSSRLAPLVRTFSSTASLAERRTCTAFCRSSSSFSDSSSFCFSASRDAESSRRESFSSLSSWDTLPDICAVSFSVSPKSFSAFFSDSSSSKLCRSISFLASSASCRDVYFNSASRITSCSPVSALRLSVLAILSRQAVS